MIRTEQIMIRFFLREICNIFVKVTKKISFLIFQLEHLVELRRNATFVAMVIMNSTSNLLETAELAK